MVAHQEFSKRLAACLNVDGFTGPTVRGPNRIPSLDAKEPGVPLGLVPFVRCFPTTRITGRGVRVQRVGWFQHSGHGIPPTAKACGIPAYFSLRPVCETRVGLPGQLSRQDPSGLILTAVCGPVRRRWSPERSRPTGSNSISSADLPPVRAGVAFFF